MELRNSFVAQFVLGARFFAEQAKDVEDRGCDICDELRSQHRAYVVASVMHSFASLEAAAVEVAMHGPGHHLGSEGNDVVQAALLAPHAKSIDSMRPALDRHNRILQLLGRKRMSPGSEPYQSASDLAVLRNVLVHHKSKWGGEEGEEGEELFGRLRSRAHKSPPFVGPGSNYFPHHCLSADCDAWASKTSMDFIDDFYLKLGVPSVLEGHRERLD